MLVETEVRGDEMDWPESMLEEETGRVAIIEMVPSITVTKLRLRYNRTPAQLVKDSGDQLSLQKLSSKHSCSGNLQRRYCNMLPEMFVSHKDPDLTLCSRIRSGNYTGSNTKLPKILLNGNNTCMAPAILSIDIASLVRALAEPQGRGSSSTLGAP